MSRILFDAFETDADAAPEILRPIVTATVEYPLSASAASEQPLVVTAET